MFPPMDMPSGYYFLLLEIQVVSQNVSRDQLSLQVCQLTLKSPTCFPLSGLSAELSGETQTHFPTVQQAQIFGLQAGRPSGNKETEQG